MATLFLEPGGDMDFKNPDTANNNAGFGQWSATTGATKPTVVNDFVHGGHKQSIKIPASINSYLSKGGVIPIAGSRISVYIYLVALGGSVSTILNAHGSYGAHPWQVRLTSAGVLQLWTGAVQIGTDGATLSTGQWYRISLASLITSTTVNRFELFVNSVSTISVTNATLSSIDATQFDIGNLNTTSIDFRFSDLYMDNSNSLTDPGDIWVTAKRPISNGTTNGFSTQVGSGGSGVGSGHSPQVNERALDITNGWSMVGAGSAITEEYNIEGKSVGDIDISAATIIDWMGWVSMKSLVSETLNMILDGANVSVSTVTVPRAEYRIKGSATYPAGTGADIGIQTTTALTTVFIYEAGVVVAYIPGVAVVSIPNKVVSTRQAINRASTY